VRTFDWDVVVLGGANMDYLVRGERLPRPGETTQGDALDEAPGGKGANQAVAAARLGARVAFVGRVGADPRGELSIQALAREGIDTSRVRRDPGALTGVALILVDRQGEKLIGVAPGANARVGEEDLRAAAPLIESARVLLSSSSCPCRSWSAPRRWPGRPDPG
jgi:ribokinase